MSVIFSEALYSQADSLQIFQTKADLLFDDSNYTEASVYYKKLIEQKPDNAQYNFRLGYCYLQSGETVAQSANFFNKAHELYSSENYKEEAQTALFYQAQAYHKSYQFDQALALYKQLTEISENKELVNSAKEGIKEVENAKDYFFNPQPLQVTRYGILNSGYDDHSPVISADEKVLMFTSKRPGNVGGKLTDSGEPFEDIYEYRKGKHPRPVNIGSPVNTEYHDATCGLSADGNELFVYRATKRDGGDIFHSIFDGEKWSDPKRLGPNINTKYRETHASLSADGQQLYITSDRKGGLGGFDIYISQKQNDGTWGPAINLGPSINTSKDEIGPYIHPDGITLYFSSDGHPGMGGFDVFFSEKKDDIEWYEPENIGFPLNTVEHDVFFVPTADGKGGYYASQKDGSTNIYKATFLAKPEKNISIVAGYVQDTEIIRRKFDKPEEYSISNDFHDPESGDNYPQNYQYSERSGTFQKAYVHGSEIVLIDSTLTVPSDVKILLKDIATGETIRDYKAADHNGRYLLTLTKQTDYILFFDADGYVFNAYNIHADQQKGFYQLNKNVELDRVSSEYLKATRTIGFEIGLTTLNDFAKLELDYLANFMTENTDLLVDISGCDYLVYDSDPNFRRLECEYAEARKRKVTEYLEAKGIESQRIRANIFPVHHSGDTLAYTLFNQKQAELEEEVKGQRKQIFQVVKTEANLSEDEIIEKYGTISVEREPYVTENMLFRINHYEPSGYNESLQQLAGFLKNDSTAVIQLTGYTDLQGRKDYNYKLSEKRAAAVKSELIKRGASEKQIQITGKGFENPIAKNKTENDEFNWDALAFNRRVEIQVLEQNNESELFVKQIEVPKEYIYPEDSERISNETVRYAIGLALSEEQKPLDFFESIEGISEKQYSNGSYLYFFGNYTNKEKVLDDFFQIRTEYPEAFIFLR
jgi:outer membrane protein OmpA-like peptidoglycan-associated protein